jgi:hypothetical protein
MAVLRIVPRPLVDWVNSLQRKKIHFRTGKDEFSTSISASG